MLIQRYSDLAGMQLVASNNHTYDPPLNRLTQLTHERGSNTVNSYRYSYDSASRITQMNSTDGTCTFSCDDTDQLTLAGL